MKKLLYLGIVLMFASCGSSIVNVDGREVSTIKIGDLEVMTEDLGDMNWEDAMKTCADLGDGWRLPTNDELNLLYENKGEIGGFAGNLYWSSTEGFNNFVWSQSFSNGLQFSYSSKKDGSSYVRAVRTI